MLLLFFLTLVCSIDVGFYSTKSLGPSSTSYLTDDMIVSKAVEQLHNVLAATDLDECTSCKMRLQVGKILSLTRPDLVPAVFVTWCKEEGYDEVECQMNFGYPSKEFSSLGESFTKMVQNMDPEGLDGDLFCYYHDDKCHVLPELPNLNLNQLWPPRPRLYDAPKPSGDLFNVLHLSGINLQKDYTLLSESNCSQAVCCSPHSFNKIDPPKDYDYASLFDPRFGLSFYDSSYETGHFKKGSFVDQYKSFTPAWLPSHEFGSYACNSPELLVNNSLQIIRDFHENHLNFEFGLITGEVTSDAGLANTGKYDVLATQQMAYNDIYHYLSAFPLFPTFGAHDTFPLNQFPHPNAEEAVTTQWQFDYLADLWSDLGWLDSQATKQVRYNKVGYSIITQRGLKIISLNSNVWNTLNLYSFVDTLNFDPFGLWQYLVDELIDSETNEQRVWIIASIPPSTNAMPVSTKVFKKIIERFSPKVIAAIFFGDMEDSFNLIYVDDIKDMDHLVNVALLGPSVSPLNGNNPSWRYYSVDSESFDIVNSFTYYTKLNHTYVNDGAEPIWEYEYSAREAYDPEQLWPMERALDMEFWHHAGEKIRDMPVINRMYSQLQCGRSPFDAYYYSKFDPEDLLNDSLVLGNDNYCKVTSFSIIDRKQCMLTSDQDNYIEPTEPKTYIATIKPYVPPEYSLLSSPPEDITPEIVHEYEMAATHDFEGKKEIDFDGSEPPEEQKDPLKKSGSKRASLESKIRTGHQQLKRQLNFGNN